MDEVKTEGDRKRTGLVSAFEGVLGGFLNEMSEYHVVAFHFVGVVVLDHVVVVALLDGNAHGLGEGRWFGFACAVVCHLCEGREIGHALENGIDCCHWCCWGHEQPGLNLHDVVVDMVGRAIAGADALAVVGCGYFRERET
eukprot:m.33931 g.33931  ORF g.33931 m.33931 type:complete len:141 (-) comp9885_c1_seq1:78-500(-)